MNYLKSQKSKEIVTTNPINLNKHCDLLHNLNKIETTEFLSQILILISPNSGTNS